MKNVAVTASLGLVLAAAAGLTTAEAYTAATGATEAPPKKQEVVPGFYNGRSVKYFDYGQIKLRPGNKLAPIWAFTNGADGQRSIVESVPGSKQYSALHKVTSVTWKSDATPRVLRSAAAVKAAQANGDLTVRSTPRVVNTALLGFGQTRHAGFAQGKTIHYYELGVVKVAPGNEILPIWTFTNGVPGQRNIADVAPGTTAYPPLWAVVEVTWTSGAQPRLVRSFEQIEQARTAGEVTLKRTSTVVNCPFV
jgi:hypothetical protein